MFFKFKADSNDNNIEDSNDILRFANFTDKVGETFYYINTEGNILDGTSFTSKEAKNKGSTASFDVTLGNGIEEIKYDSPVLSNKDQIFIFIDTDYNAETGFSAGGIGAEKVIEIDGANMLIMLKGSVPGNNGTEVVLKPAVKKAKNNGK